MTALTTTSITTSMLALPKQYLGYFYTMNTCLFRQAWNGGAILLWPHD